MSLKRTLPNILAGLATPYALWLGFAGLLGVKLIDLPRPVGAAVLIAGFVFVLAVSLWEPISPPVYGLSIVAGFLTAGCLFSLVSSGNLVGLAVIVVVLYGFVVGIAVSVFGLLLRRLTRLHRWLPLGLLIAVAAFSLAANLGLWWSQREHTRKIVAVVEQIRRAELTYAASQSDHHFTCNGTDLPGIENIKWKANEDLGLQEKSQSYIEDHWVSLKCDTSANSRWVEIAAGSMVGARVGDAGHRVIHAANWNAA